MKLITKILLLINTMLLPVCFYGCKETPRNLKYTTKCNLSRIRFFMLMYREKIGQWPKSLDDLSIDEEYIAGGDEFNKTKDIFHDAWNNPIIYTQSSNSKVHLISYGRDGKLGGTGEDADIIMEFDENFDVNPPPPRR